ncbi:uracil-DNA glycosylase family protein [Parasphingopyxis algicola]|uniref:uracil-DNA glycosylase family protein n=1 Tax=Parasphingopyxis algicola TaxID=2026624 RepID=UPI0015A0E2B1|nr:uracil-DNA glycosylase family protein [Parasphingopyxis algicola]QLC26213.1 uracil-DNA glycosylase family protein [Parasphingopyxis algicola]
MTLDTLLPSIRDCRLCAGTIPEPIRPVLQAHRSARILIAGQAPGRKVQASGVPFDDASGERLRDWMGVDRETFYDPARIAILPMAFCYPGKGKSGDLPPPPVCAETWRETLLAKLPNLRLTLVIGQYAMGWHLDTPRRTLTETVRNWRDFDAATLPLPHPSPRNNIWLAKNPWFGEDLLPHLRSRVACALEA